MDRVRDEIVGIRRPHFIYEQRPVRAIKDVIQSFKYSATNKYSYTIKDTLDAVRDQLYDKIRDNRNNTTQKKASVLMKYLIKILENIISKKNMDTILVGIDANLTNITHLIN